MSFDEEEDDEDENSSSSSQLNSNTRPSSATSRKSIRVSEPLLCLARGWASAFQGLVIQVGGELSVERCWRAAFLGHRLGPGACQEFWPRLFCPPALLLVFFSQAGRVWGAGVGQDDL